MHPQWLRLMSTLAALLLLSTPAPLLAEPIRITITSGSVSFNPNVGEGGDLRLNGTNGFSVTGFPELGNTDPHCCLTPGTSTSMRGRWSSNDLPATVTLGDDTFTNVGDLNSSNQLEVDFRSTTFTLPPIESSRSTAVTAPFTLTGSFRGTPGNGPRDPDG